MLLGAGLFVTLVMAVQGVLIIVLAVPDWRHPVPKTETVRHVLDADALEMIADMPEDAGVKRLLIQHAIDFD